MRLLPIVSAGLLLAGCASLDTGPDAHAVADESERRIGTRAEVLSPADLQTLLDSVLADGLTQDEAARLGALNNPRARAAYESIGIARADLVRAGLLTNPVFDFSIRFIERGGGEVIDMGLSQRLTELLALPLRSSLAETDVAIARAHAVGAAIDGAFDARRAYVRLQAAGGRRAALAEGVEARRLAYEYTARLHDAGNVTDLELTRRRTAYEQSRLALADAEAEELMASESLSAATGLWGKNAGFTLADPLGPPGRGELPASLEADAVRASLELEAARLQLQRAARRAGAAGTLAVLDGVEAGVSAERNESREWEVGPSLSVPIPIFDTGAAGRAGAEAEMRRERELYMAAALGARTRARMAAISLDAASSAERHWSRVLVPLAEQEVGEALLQYNAMNLGTAELLESRHRLATSRAEYTRALSRAVIAGIDVEQILAGGAPEIGPATTDAAPLSSGQSGGH